MMAESLSWSGVVIAVMLWLAAAVGVVRWLWWRRGLGLGLGGGGCGESREVSSVETRCGKGKRGVEREDGRVTAMQ